jgi:hypothetical protein
MSDDIHTIALELSNLACAQRQPEWFGSLISLIGTLLGGTIGWWAGRRNADHAFKLREDADTKETIVSIFAEIKVSAGWLDDQDRKFQGMSDIPIPSQSVSDYLPVLSANLTKLGKLNGDLRDKILHSTTRLRMTLLGARRAENGKSGVHVSRDELAKMIPILRDITQSSDGVD